MTVIDEVAEQARPKIRVMIAIPCGDDVKAGFAYDLANLLGQTVYNRRDIELSLVMDKGTLLPMMRSSLVEEAFRRDATHILWLDSDMRFPAETLVRLLGHHVPVVAANYITRRFPLVPVSRKAIDIEGLTEERLWTEPGDTGLVEVAGAGMGVMLCDIDVFKFLRQPWFRTDFIERIGLPNGYIGEDLYFCDKLRKNGISVLVDQDLSQHIRHEGSWDYSHAHALAQREAMQSAAASAPQE